MKDVLILKDARLLWQTIQIYLGGINAAVRVVDAGEPEEKIAGGEADLLIMGAEQFRSGGVPRGYLKVIVIDPGGSLGELSGKLRRGDSCLEWPCSRERFLEQTASVLGVAPRKVFQTVIRIFVPSVQYGVVGKSADFSLTGMSFTAEGFFSIGQKVSVSLSLPAEQQRIILEGKVARSRSDNGGRFTLYGVEFGDIDRATEEALKTFVLS